MKIFRTLILLLVCFYSSQVYGQGNGKLAEKIDSLFIKDQRVQQDIQKAIGEKVSMDSIQKLIAIQQETFKRHIPIIKEVYNNNGYPTIKKVGKEASHHFFTLIQHADSDPLFQSTMLPVLKRLSKKGEIQKKDYAFLYDRVQRNTGKKQLYGTQLSYDSNGNLFDSLNKIILPPDLADPTAVDKRRKKIGLEPLEQYYERVLAMLGRPRKKI